MFFWLMDRTTETYNNLILSTLKSNFTFKKQEQLVYHNCTMVLHYLMHFTMKMGKIVINTSLKPLLVDPNWPSIWCLDQSSWTIYQVLSQEFQFPMATKSTHHGQNCQQVSDWPLNITAMKFMKFVIQSMISNL